MPERTAIACVDDGVFMLADPDTRTLRVVPALGPSVLFADAGDGSISAMQWKGLLVVDLTTGKRAPAGVIGQGTLSRAQWGLPMGRGDSAHSMANGARAITRQRTASAILATDVAMKRRRGYRRGSASDSVSPPDDRRGEGGVRWAVQRRDGVSGRHSPDR